MTYEDSLLYLESLQRFGINLGLTRIERLLELLGRPERQFRSVHIAGTNGKGSTTAMLSSVLTAAGIRTGMYISPHLDEYTERISIDGMPVSRDEFAAAIQMVAEFAERMAAEGFEHPTEFELITAAAFHHFASAGVEYAVIEVGLGGRIDSTNVITPEVAIITNVTLEHADKLGSELSEIAGHKAGVIKSGKPIVTAAQGEALAVIAAEAAKQDAPLYIAGQDFSCISQNTLNERQQFLFRSAGHEAAFTISLLGRHQLENAGMVLMAVQLLAQVEPRLTDSAVRTGLSRAAWPGRFEILAHRPDVIVDGAHNPDGARALRVALDDLYPDQPVVFVLGILADKDITGIVETLVKAKDRVVAVRPDSPRAADPTALAARFAPGQAMAVESMQSGIREAVHLAGSAGVVCIAGSLYQVGEARREVEKASLGGQLYHTSL